MSDYSSLDAAILGYGVVLLFCVPVLYIFDFTDLIPLALSMGIFSFIIVFFGSLVRHVMKLIQFIKRKIIMAFALERWKK